MSSQPQRRVDLDEYINYSDNISDGDDLNGGLEKDLFSDDNDLNGGLDKKLSSIANSTLKYLNYAEKYIPHWDLDEAFREIYQNWRDGIFRSNTIDPSQFRTAIKDVDRLILITAHKANSNEILGFICFQYDKNGLCVKGLRVANFRATLKYENLGTGATSKAPNSGQAGQHGEGMKLSALIFRRNNYNFRIESGEFRWSFIFKRGEFACGLRRMSKKELDKSKQDEMGKPRTVVARPWEDVCVVIGAPGVGRTIKNKKIKGERIHVDRFRQMLKVTLDISPPEKIVHTFHGDLIRDPIYQGKMYLRGLLLPSGGATGKSYAYGYNFVYGKTSRDRQSLTSSWEESTCIANIWASAIEADDSDDSELLTAYTQLLLQSLNKKGDAILSSNKICLREPIARKVWKKMRTMNRDLDGRLPFYYSAFEGKDEVHIIEQSLNRNHVPIDLEMWKMMRKFKLCRTPGEELLHRFRTAAEIIPPIHSFAVHVEKMLRCLLQSSSATKDTDVTFVNGERLNIDVGFFDSTWRIHDKWLTYEGAHEHTFCEEFRSNHQIHFACDHVVLHLWDLMISQLKAMGKEFSQHVHKEEAWLKSMAKARLSQMPRSVECVTTSKRGELRVVWSSEDSHRNKDKPIRVILHADACTGESEWDSQPCNAVQYFGEEKRKCTCPSQVSEAVSSGVIFANLDPERSYITSVSHDMEGAFVAVQPHAMKPRSKDRSLTPPQEHELRSNPVAVDVSFPISSTEVSPLGADQTSYQPDDGEDDDIGGACGIIHGNISSSEDDDSMDDRSLYKPTPSVVPPSVPRSLAHVRERGAAGQQPPKSLQAEAFVATRRDRAPRKTTSNDGVQTDISVPPTGEMYSLGGQIEHRSLDWGGSFPGSHAFYRTRDHSDEDIFILKPKQQTVAQPAKRKANQELPARVAKRNLQAYVSDRSVEPLDLGSPVPRRNAFPARAGSAMSPIVIECDARGATRGPVPSMTPLPEGGITYRY